MQRNLNEAVAAAVAFGNALGKSLEDGKIDLSDLPKFIDPVTKLPAAIEGIGEVPREFSEMTPEEREALVTHLKTEFDIPQERAEAVAEAAVDVLFDLGVLISFLHQGEEG